MKKYFYNILLFLAPILIIGTTFEILLRKIPTAYTYKSSYLEKNAAKLKTLILGNSHSLYGVNPEYIDGKTFNVSHLAQSIDYDLEIFKRFENNFSNLETVVVRYSYSTLFYQLNLLSNRSWREKDYTIYYKIKSRNPIKYNSEMLTIKLSENINRLQSFYLKGRKDVNWSNLGWRTDGKPEDSFDLVETGKKRANEHFYQFDCFDENISFLRELIKRCQSKNIKVILLTFPAYKTYIENLDSNRYSLFLKSGNILEKEFSNCSYLNLLADDRFSEEDFYDADHLNTNGAKKLSIILNQYISDK